MSMESGEVHLYRSKLFTEGIGKGTSSDYVGHKEVLLSSLLPIFYEEDDGYHVEYA